MEKHTIGGIGFFSIQKEKKSLGFPFTPVIPSLLSDASLMHHHPLGNFSENPKLGYIFLFQFQQTPSFASMVFLYYILIYLSPSVVHEFLGSQTMSHSSLYHFRLPSLSHTKKHCLN